MALGLAVGAVVVGLDQITKRIAETSFSSSPITVIPDWLWFTFHENPGSAFSLFQNAGPFLGGVAFLAALVVVVTLRGPRPISEAVAFGLILGGALGNLTDRVVRGENFLDGRVIDWIQVPNFPVFNIADSSITVAVAVLLVTAWRHPKKDILEDSVDVPGEVVSPGE